MPSLESLDAQALRKRRAPEGNRTHPAEEAAGSAIPVPEILSGGGHIRVAVRVRPIPPNDESIIEVAGEGAISVRKQAATGGNEFLSSQQERTEERMFDRVFGPAASQAEVYRWCCQPLIVAAAREGRSATVFVYGATGAGKTHTMFGERDEAQQGLIYRAIREIFKTVDLRPARDGRRLEVKLSFLDIYNEAVRDLLQEGNALCKVLEDERRGFVKVTNLKEVFVQSAEEALKQLRLGLQARKVEATAANSRSSRSHAVFSLTIEQVDPAPPGPGHAVFQRKGAEPRRLYSRICLIDLAGSERANQTQNVGAALEDGAKINQSLLALANCIDALSVHSQGRERSQTPRRKPPYRDSKLTLLLKSSLTSDCLVSMIANVHPGGTHFEDSNNTLEYAKRASVMKAPVLVRRARAASLPASRPPSESPPSSTPASPGGERPSHRGIRASAPVVTAVPGMDIAPKRRRTVEGRPAMGCTEQAPRGLKQRSPRYGTPEERGLCFPSHSTTQFDHTRSSSSTSSRSGSIPLRERPPCSSSTVTFPQRLSRCSESPSSSGSSPFNTAPCSEAHSPAGRFETAPPSPAHIRITPRGEPRTSGASELSLCSARGLAHEDDNQKESEQSVHALAVEAMRFIGKQGHSKSLSLAGQSAKCIVKSKSSSAVDDYKQQLSLKEIDEVKANLSPAPSRGRAPRRVAFSGKAGGSMTNCLHSSPIGTTQDSQNVALLLRLVDTLQREKLSLHAQISAMQGDRDRLDAESAQLRADRNRIETEAAQLRASNLEKDQQIALLLADLHGDGTVGRHSLPVVNLASQWAR